VHREAMLAAITLTLSRKRGKDTRPP